MNSFPEHLRRHEIPEPVALVKGNGDLAKISVKTDWSTAEIYLLGAHVTEFQKNGEPSLLFMSKASQFVVGSRFVAECRSCFRGLDHARVTRCTDLLG
jgi:hypothetical protein